MKTALVLSGGGAGGAFQVGVLEQLWRDEKLNISTIYGTSVGALNGAALRQIDFEAMYQLWMNIKSNDDIIRFNWLTLLGLSKGKYSTKPLKEIIEKMMKWEPVNSWIDVYVTACDIETSQLYYFKSGHPNFKDMVLASASVPFHMEPVGKFIDGGVRDHTPIIQAIKDGHKRVIVITSKPLQYLETDQKWKMTWPYFLNIGLRCTDILQAEVFWNDIEPIMLRKAEHGGLTLYPEVQIEVYAPDVRIIDTFEYDPVKIRMAIDQGRRAYAKK